MPNSKHVEYVCERCDFKCSKKSNYNVHLRTQKHNTYMNTYTFHADMNMQSNEYECKCGNVYKHRQSLYTHKKVCGVVNDNAQTAGTSLSDNEQTQPNTSSNSQLDMTLVFELLKQNQEFKELMIEQSKQIAGQQQQNQMLLEQQQNNLLEQQQQNNKLLEAVKDGKLGNTINNTTNKFNLNLFLNETCKDAITMNDFINSFEVTREDFIRTGNVGFVEGISTVMMKRIRNMELHTRPLHCTDLKRETVYIKNDDKWEKEDIDKTQLRKAVKTVAHKNMNELKRWYSDSKPEVDTIGTDEYENYLKYYQAALGGYDKEEDIKFEEKIIKNVLKEVQVDKTLTTV